MSGETIKVVGVYGGKLVLKCESRSKLSHFLRTSRHSHVKLRRLQYRLSSHCAVTQPFVKNVLAHSWLAKCRPKVVMERCFGDMIRTPLEAGASETISLLS